MSDAARTRRSYDLVAERYATELGDELRHKPLDRALLDAFAEVAGDGLVAGLGCGPAHVAAYLAGRGVPVVGMDLSPAMCAAAARSGIPASAADLTALPIRSHALNGLICLYAVIHLDTDHRAASYAEFARVLSPGGHALIAFHTSDADLPTGGARHLDAWWGHDVDLTFHFLDPAAETDALAAAGLTVIARLDRAPHGPEHASNRCYLLLRRSPTD